MENIMFNKYFFNLLIITRDYDKNYIQILEKSFNKISNNLKNINLIDLDENDGKMCEIIGIHYQKFNFEEMKKYFHLGIKAKNSNCALKLAKYYLKQENNKQLFIGFIHIAMQIDSDCCDIANLYLGTFYEKEKDYEKAKYYYLLSNNYESHIYLSLIYRNIHKNDELFEFNLLCAININKDKTFDKLKFIYDNNNLIIFSILNSIKNTNEKIESLKEQLKNDKKVRFYYNKIKLFADDIKLIEECKKCNQNKINIDFSCAHTICIDCYVFYDNCPFCVEESNKKIKK
jgi:TPR repeat protein